MAQKNILIIVLCVTLILMPISTTNLLGATHDCTDCDGYAGWSGGVPPTKPDCDTYVATRTLGTCSGTSTGSCNDDDRKTKHTKSYLFDPDPWCVIACGTMWGVCVAACNWVDPSDVACGLGCLADRHACEANCGDCLIIDDIYSNPQSGCH